VCGSSRGFLWFYNNFAGRRLRSFCGRSREFYVLVAVPSTVSSRSSRLEPHKLKSANIISCDRLAVRSDGAPLSCRCRQVAGAAADRLRCRRTAVQVCRAAAVVRLPEVVRRPATRDLRPLYQAAAAAELEAAEVEVGVRCFGRQCCSVVC